MKTILEIPVRSTEIDFLGHVNNTKYLDYMQWGREDWYMKAGLTFEMMLEKNIGTVIANISIDYLSASYLGEVLVIETEPLEVGNTSLKMRQDILKKDSGQEVSSAEVTVVFIAMDTEKSTPIPAELKKLLKNS
ncbi:MAG: acyl-CoA thioesterase [Bacillota bacterium]